MAEEDVWSRQDAGNEHLQLSGVGILSDLTDKWARKSTQDTCLIGRMCEKHGPYCSIKRPDLTKLADQCAPARYWTIPFAVFCKRCKSVPWLFAGVQNWFALLKMQEGSSSSASRVLGEIAAFSRLKCCPRIWMPWYFLPLCVILSTIYSPIPKGSQGNDGDPFYERLRLVESLRSTRRNKILGVCLNSKSKLFFSNISQVICSTSLVPKSSFSMFAPGTCVFLRITSRIKMGRRCTNTGWKVCDTSELWAGICC